MSQVDITPPLQPLMNITSLIIKDESDNCIAKSDYPKQNLVNIKLALE